MKAVQDGCVLMEFVVGCEPLPSGKCEGNAKLFARIHRQDPFNGCVSPLPAMEWRRAATNKGHVFVKELRQWSVFVGIEDHFIENWI